MLRIDDRERHIINTIERNCINCSIEIVRLQTGDYGFYINEKLIWVIERKTWVDLSASINDRLSKQLLNFLEMYEKDNSVKCFFIIEGKIPHHNSFVGNIKKEYLENKIVSIMFDYPFINFIYTDSKLDTARWIQKLIDTTHKKIKIPEYKDISQNDLLQKCHKNTLLENAIIALTNIKFMTKSLALIILKDYKCCDIFTLPPEYFAELSYISGRKIGVKYATKLHYSINTIGLAKFFEGIKGVSKSTSIILSKIGTITVENMSNAIRAGGKKIGNKIAERIWDIYDFKI
jgi:ERCC4-type nuclease